MTCNILNKICSKKDKGEIIYKVFQGIYECSQDARNPLYDFLNKKYVVFQSHDRIWRLMNEQVLEYELVNFIFY
jgi:hypothetical protein